MANIVYMGTPYYSVPPMDKLLAAGHKISLLICQPDKKQGRGHRLLPPATKKFALQHNIEIFQPNNFRTAEVQIKLQLQQADFFVVIAYGKILPKVILAIPKQACINVHGSLLPKWRGAAPIQFSLLNGESETGVCSMLMDEGMDTGDLLLAEKTKILPEDTLDNLSRRMAEMSADIILKTITMFDQITPQPQNNDLATYTRLISNQDRLVNWQQSASLIYNQFRGLSPKPGIFTYFRTKRIMLKSISSLPNFPQSAPPGTLLRPNKNELLVSCGSGAIQINACQPENKKKMDVKDFLNGYQIKNDEKFENEL
jgi:methionyl-tRNA formyltransferase